MINIDLNRTSYYQNINTLKTELLHRIINVSIHFHIHFNTPKYIIYTHAHAHMLNFYKLNIMHMHPPSHTKQLQTT